jgi:hypothetical protein
MRARARTPFLALWTVAVAGWLFAGWLVLHLVAPPPAADRWLVPYTTPNGGVLQVDARLVPALQVLAGIEPGPQLLDAVADSGTVLLVALGPLDDEWGHHTPQAGVIVVDPALEGADPRTVATLLAHELTHARRELTGQVRADEEADGPEAACVADEHEAQLNELQVWQTTFGPEGKAGATHAYERQVNLELARYQRAPERFATTAARRHAGQCRETLP